MKRAIKIQMGDSYKLGMNEVVGLRQAMLEVFQPVATHLNELDNWSGDDWFKIEDVEYKSRDGFIAHSHNCGGLELRAVVPKCGEYEFDFLEFGECDECGTPELGLNKHGEPAQCGYEGQECAHISDGHLDAQLRVWFKFEGLEDGTLKFYICAGGGNGDAPYFRTKYESDLFEASFEAKSIQGIKRAASKHVKALLKVLGGK